MPLPRDNSEEMETFAQESLETFSRVSEKAETELERHSPTKSDGSVLASVNTMADGEPVQNLGKIDQKRRDANRKLAKEPAIARIVALNEDDVPETYFICRDTPVSLDDSSIKLASYYSPIGKLASQPPGEEISVPIGNRVRSLQIVETAELKPVKQDHGLWDSLNTKLRLPEKTSYTIASLRMLLDGKEGASTAEEDTLEQLLNEDRDRENILKGLRHERITQVALRDQPILDQFQDDIFRLPLNAQLLLLGAPGTGKTTTLIRRLGQKLRHDFLVPEEARLLGGLDKDHSTDWLMFTPTDLLRLYVKEAFNKENIAASDERITTWNTHRAILGRRVFNILRSENRRGGFIVRESVNSLQEGTEAQPIDWFKDFQAWQKELFLNDMRKAANSLSGHNNRQYSELGKLMLETLDTIGNEVEPKFFEDIARSANILQELLDKLKNRSDEMVRESASLQVKEDRDFLDKLAAFAQDLKEVEGADESADDDDMEDDESENQQPVVGRQAAMRLYKRTLHAQARARLRKRNVASTSKAGGILEWLGQLVPDETFLQELGDNLAVQSHIRRFATPTQRYINGLPTRYRRFRQARQKEGKWYRDRGFSRNDIHPLEVDLVLLSILQESNKLIRNTRTLENNDGTAKSVLDRLREQQRTQILVDEATDFSPIQLACMYNLARPEIRSFFACGDFNQRVTNWGARSHEQLSWAIPGIETETIRVAYRQSQQLHRLATELMDLPDNESDLDAALPEHVRNEGVPPTLCQHLDQLEDKTEWLAERIREIERIDGTLPSIGRPLKSCPHRR